MNYIGLQITSSQKTAT